MDPGCAGSVGFGQLNEIRVCQLCTQVAAIEGVALNLFQHPPGIIVKDQDHGTDAVLDRGAKLLNVVLEAAVAGYHHHLALGAAHFGSQARRETEAEARPSGGSKVGVGLIEGEAPGRAVVGHRGIADYDGVAGKNAADAFQGPKLVGVLAYQTFADAFLQIRHLL